MAREVDSVTDIIQMSCSHLCHGSCGFTAAACWKSLAHAEPLMSRGRVRTMEAYVAKSNARLALKCTATAINVVKDTIQYSGVVIVYFLFVLESSFLSLTLSNWVSHSASGSRSPNSTNLRSLMACTKCPGIGGKPDAGRNKST